MKLSVVCHEPLRIKQSGIKGASYNYKKSWNYSLFLRKRTQQTNSIEVPLSCW